MLKQFIGWCLAALLALSFCSIAQAQAFGEERIAIVNSDRILHESKPAQDAQARLQQEFSKRDNALNALAKQLKDKSDALDKNGANMSDSERDRRQRELAQLNSDFERQQRDLRDDANERRNEDLAALLECANKVIKSIAEQNHYDLVLQEAVYVNPRIDITNQVLAALAQPSVNRGDCGIANP